MRALLGIRLLASVAAVMVLVVVLTSTIFAHGDAETPETTTVVGTDLRPVNSDDLEYM